MTSVNSAGAGASYTPSYISGAVEFTETVMREDADACELNQRGLRSIPHKRGVLMPEEYLISDFHQWVKAQVAQA